jgi:transcriptional regulator with XRE-family HTH domain
MTKAEIARQLGVSRSLITMLTKGERKTRGGKYETEVIEAIS